MMGDVMRRDTNKGRKLSGSWNTLSTLFKKGVWQVAHHMSEGRRSQVVLLDERRLDIVIQSRLFAGELLDIVASHFNIKEKEYFGITFIDDTGQSTWLQLDKRVLEYDFPKKSSSQGSVLTFYFKIKYFVESITQLNDSATIEAFYLQAKSLVSKGELEIDSEITFQLAALVIQATYGDFIDESIFKNHLKRLPVLPTSVLKEYSTISVCENKVLEHYKSLVGQTRGDAIVNYLSILESLPTYGQHYYEIKDKSGNYCCLGLSHRGISEYDKNDRRIPKRVFLWKQLENLYFRDKKFTVEVHEARRVVHTLSSFNLYEDAIEEPVEEFDDLSSAICDPTTQVSVSRRALGPASVTVYVWYATSPNIAKCIWSMAIAQHQFFLEHNHKKNRSCVVRSLSQIASELCRSVQSLSSASSVSNISRSTSSTSIPTIVIEGELSEESKAATIEMLTALQSRKDALQETLKKKTEELKVLCLKEGELTGELPPETPFQPGEPQPQVRRRIGTSFTLSDKVMCRAKGKDRETLNDLELDYEIQSKIASAAFKLANDVTARKSVRKMRKISYQQATTKLKDIEEKLCTLKREKETKKKSQSQDTCSEGSASDNRVSNHLGLPASSSENSIADRNVNLSLSSGVVPPSTSLPLLSEPACTSAPPSPAKCRQRHQSLQHVPVITSEVYEDVALPYTVQTRRNSSSYSAASEFDSISCGSSSIASLGIQYRNRFEASLNIEGTNHYSVPNRRASQAFNDPDELILDDISQCCTEDNSSRRYASAAVLSASYDERMFHKGGEFTLMPDNVSAIDCSYDKSSIGSNGLSCNDSNYQLPANCDLSKKDKCIHSHSENSLHRQRAHSLHHRLEQIHISEPELNLSASQLESNIPHSYNVPMLRNILRPTSTILPANVSEYCSSSMSNQNIHQVAELVQASVLLQDSKRAASSTCLEHCSPKIKTKEWTETSLDSPLVCRKRKSKLAENLPPNSHCQQAEWLDNGLPTSYQCYGYQTQPKYMDDFSTSSNSTCKFRQSPSPVQHQYNMGSCSNDYRNLSPKVVYQSQLPHERIYVNSSQLVADGNMCHHYENTAEMSANHGNFTQQQSNSCFENVHENYKSNYKNIPHDILPNTHQRLSAFDDSPTPKLGIAEPQQPSKHHMRRMNTDDIFPPENIPCMNELDCKHQMRRMNTSDIFLPENNPIMNEADSKHQMRRMNTGDIYPLDNISCMNEPDSKHQMRRVNTGDIFPPENIPCMNEPDTKHQMRRMNTGDIFPPPENIPCMNEPDSKHQMRRINTGDIFPSENIPCMNEPDSKHQMRRMNTGDIYPLDNISCMNEQDSKHQMRRMNTGDIFPQENVPCMNEPDYQNIPMDNQYEPVNYRDASSCSSYTEALHCDVTDSSHYSHSPYHDNLSNSTTDCQQASGRQQPVTPVSVENPALSPVSQNMNFSPNVEVNVVSVGHFQPYWEETKPYELSDFYKYSTKHRKQHKSSSSDIDSQSYVEKENIEINHQYYEHNPRENANVQYSDNMNVQYREFHYPNEATHASNVLPSVNQHQELVKSHIPVFDSSAQLESPAKYYAENSISSPPQPCDPDKSLSFGEVELRISLADTFHEEMVAWYQNQDSVKKATLV